MVLNELRDKAYDIACRHGWHDEKLSDEHYLMLIITEISEAVEADRKGKHANVANYKKKVENSRVCQGLDPEISKGRGYQAAFEYWIKDTIEDELADVVIRCFDLAGMRNIDYNVKEGVTQNSQFELLKAAAEYHALESCFTEWCYTVVGIITQGNSLDITLNLIVMMVLTYCKCKDIDIIWHIEQKMRYNENRPWKHNKEY